MVSWDTHISVLCPPHAGCPVSPQVGVWSEGLPSARPGADLGVEVSTEPPQPSGVTEGPGTWLEG